MINSQNEQSDSRRWVWVLLGRGLSFVTLGVMTTAVQLGLVWVLLGWVMGGFRVEHLGEAVWWGLGMGAAVGLLVYGGLYGVMAFSRPWACREIEPSPFFAPVFWGMALGLVAGFSFCFSFNWLDQHGYLNLSAGYGYWWVAVGLLVSIPLAMLCGGVGGAVWKWGRLKAAMK